MRFTLGVKGVGFRAEASGFRVLGLRFGLGRKRCRQKDAGKGAEF